MRFPCSRVAAMLVISAACVPARGEDAGRAADQSVLTDVLSRAPRQRRAEILIPAYDARLKALLGSRFGEERVRLSLGIQTVMDDRTIERFAAANGRIDERELQRIVQADAPASRKGLFPDVALHVARLTTTFDRIRPEHRPSSDALVEWLAENYQPDEPLHVIVVCTGNSRRSMLGAIQGNMAAAYYGLPEIRFRSGGTNPSAFNRRTISTLRDMGVVVEPTGEEAPRGDAGAENPIYRVRWGTGVESTPQSAFEMREFSKHYADPSNPQQGFAAVLVCGEADEACPAVAGAALRVPLPFEDPKASDDTPLESARYAERRNDIGRTFLSILMRVRQRVTANDR